MSIANIRAPGPGIEAAIGAGFVGLSFILFNQYWKVDEHVVFALVLLFAMASFVRLGSASSFQLGTTKTSFFYFGFLLWVVLSVLWSPFPSMTLSYALLVLLTGASAVILGFSYGLRVSTVGIALGVSALALHVSVSEFISRDLMLSSPGWGLYTNPSSLMFVVGIGVISAAYLPNRNPLTWFLGAVLGLLSIFWLLDFPILTVFISLAGTFYVSMAILLLRSVAPRWKKVVGYGLSLVALGAVGLFLLFRSPVLAILGEDESISDRVPLWDSYIEAISWRPWIGSGWGTTVGWDFPLSEDWLAPVFEWFPAHNGYLDIGLMLGILGLLLFLVGIIGLFLESLSVASSSSNSPRTAYIPALISFVLVHDLAATSLPKLVGIFLIGLMIGAKIRLVGDGRLPGAK